VGLSDGFPLQVEEMIDESDKDGSGAIDFQVIFLILRGQGHEMFDPRFLSSINSCSLAGSMTPRKGGVNDPDENRMLSIFSANIRVICKTALARESGP
jgi:hypothetical protein